VTLTLYPSPCVLPLSPPKRRRVTASLRCRSIQSGVCGRAIASLLAVFHPPQRAPGQRSAGELDLAGEEVDLVSERQAAELALHVARERARLRRLGLVATVDIAQQGLRQLAIALQRLPQPRQQP